MASFRDLQILIATKRSQGIDPARDPDVRRLYEQLRAAGAIPPGFSLDRLGRPPAFE